MRLLIASVVAAVLWSPVASADVNNYEIQHGCTNYGTAGLPACPTAREAQATVCTDLAKGYDWRVVFRDLYNNGTTYHNKALSMAVILSAVNSVCPAYKGLVPDNDSGELDSYA